MSDTANTGEWNTGYRNAGNWNTGDLNTGNWNTGDLNTGCLNTGDLNTGDRNTGYLNTGDGVITIFDQPCDMDREKLESAIYEAVPPIPLIVFVDTSDMTVDEKTEHPNHDTIGGYLKAFKSIQAAGADAWSKLDASEQADRRSKIEALPNYDAKKFFECTGIDLRDGRKQGVSDRDEIVVDGVRYRRVAD